MTILEEEEYKRLCEENHVTQQSCLFCGRGIKKMRPFVITNQYGTYDYFCSRSCFIESAKEELKRLKQWLKPPCEREGQRYLKDFLEDKK